MTGDHPVLASLPDGVAEYATLVGPREARGGGRHFHHCRHCGGWIEGWPQIAMGRLLGEHHVYIWRCCRCNGKLASHGAQS